MKSSEMTLVLALSVLVFSLLHLTAAEQCGGQAQFALCPNNLCCSQWGWCGDTDEYCGAGCQSQCHSAPAPPAPPSGGGLASVIDEKMFNSLFPNRNQIYTYSKFVQAANLYPQIGTEGTKEQKLREVAAFAAHVQQETAGLFYTREIDQSNSYCDGGNRQYPCASGQKYFGRGPLQLSWNYNYGAARDTGIGADILANPDIVAQNGLISFRASFWFWTRTDYSIPSIHDVIVGKWKPTQQDINGNRKPGFGTTINIINGGQECGRQTDGASKRIQYYKDFCSKLGVDPGPNLSCASSAPF